MQWYVNNPDSYQYLQIARHYMHGFWPEAINGYWSPMQSWLLIPFLGVFDPIRGMKFLLLLEGMLAFICWINWVQRFPVSQFFRNLLIYGSIPFILSYAYLVPTADLLFLALVLYLPSAIPHLYSGKKRNAIWYGLFGALLYFAKSFGLPLFIVWSITVILYERRKGISYPTRRNLLTAALAFLIPVLTWSSFLAVKYKHVTLSEAARFNMTREVSPTPGKMMALPLLSGGIVKPAGAHAISAWEEPMQVLKLNPVNPLASVSDAKFYARVVERNLLTIWYYDFRRQPGIFFLLLSVVFLVIEFRKKKINSSSTQTRLINVYEYAQVFYAFVLLLCFYLGYSLILVHTRYIWICTWLLLMLSAWLISVLFSGSSGIKNKAGNILMLCILLLALKRPAKEILFTIDKDYPLTMLGNGILNPLETMYHSYEHDRRIHHLTIALQDRMPDPGAIVSLGNYPGDRHTYSAGLNVAYYSNHSFYGMMENEKYADLPAEVKYLLIWDSGIAAPEGLTLLFSDAATKARLFMRAKSSL